MSALLKLVNVTKTFGSRTILDRVNLAVHPGNHILFQGPSGCGKTTILRCMALLEVIQDGYIEFESKTVIRSNAKNVLKKTTRLNIGMVFQGLYLWPHLTVLKNIYFPLEKLGHSKKEVEKKAFMLLEQFGMQDYFDRYPNSLSGGEQQRVALARAFIHSPKIMLLDEVTSNLDAANTEIVMQMISEICRKGTTVIMASHSGIIPTDASFKKLVFNNGNWND